MEGKDVRDIASALIKLAVLASAEQALETAREQAGAGTPDPGLPATEQALLVARDVQLVRWQSDALLLIAQTTLGATVSMVLNPQLTAHVRESLEKEIPSRG